MKVELNAVARAKLNSFVTLFLILCITSLIAWLSVRHPLQMDWTQNRKHSLSQASLEVLNRLEGELLLTAYARENKYLRQEIEDLVRRYRRHKPDIKLRFVDPDTAPDEVRSKGIGVNGEMLLHYKGRTEHVRSRTESEFTNALARLARTAEHWLAFLEGHGERAPLGHANHDLRSWGLRLVAQGFNIQPVNVAQLGTIPENVRVLVIASPSVDLLPGEVALILDHLERGGNLLWFADSRDAPALDAVAEQLGLTVADGVAIDTATRFVGIDDPTIVLSTPSIYPQHEITEDFHYTTLFPSVSALVASDNASDWHNAVFLRTGDHVWLERGELTDAVEYQEQEDHAGPLDIGVALTRAIKPANETTTDDAGATRQQRAIVIGDGDFLSNTYVENSGNLELGLRMINWLSHDDDFINIPPTNVKDARLELSLPLGILLGFGFPLALPLLLSGAGVLIWWLRRKR